METSKKRQVIFGLIWLIVFPLSTWIAYHFFPSREVDWINLTILFVLIFVTISIPIRIQEVTVSLEKWVTFGIFLQYGVFVELLVVQLTIFIMLFSQKTSLPLHYKFFINSTMFSLVSISSGFIFYFLGGETGSYNFEHVIIFMVIYAFSYTVINNLLLQLYFKTRQMKFSLLSTAGIWDFITTMIMVPFSISLYFLHEYLGNQSVFLIGVPLLLALVAIKVFNESSKTNDQLSNAGKLGRELADRLLFDEVMSLFLRRLKTIIDFKNGYVVDLRSQKHFIPLMEIDDNQIIKKVESIIFEKDLSPNDGIHLKQSLILYNEKELQKLKNITFKQKVKSALVVPIIRENKTEGFLFLTSHRKNNFFEEDIQIVEMLAGFFALSLQKARFYENALNESEVCRLTSLNNFRHLDRKLEKKVDYFNKGEIKQLSIIVLDIDYFKSINDTYGHENGNIILKELAKILKRFQEKGTTLARYGGEEFIFLLPNYTKKEAALLAEKIRKTVANTTITISPDLSETKEEVKVQITISLGVATMPEDSSSGSSLMRHADRALYLGGKQAGRNRVGLLSH